MKDNEFLYGWTSDGLRLEGNHWSANKKDTCVVCTHGMSGNIIENYFAVILGQELSKRDIGFIYGHNRGYNHINDIRTREKKNNGYVTKRIGVAYERFKECIYDINLWVAQAKKLGYKRIILMGHSLGCNKTIYYYSIKKPKNVIGIILASPPDMVGLGEMPKYEPHHKQMLQEALNNVKNSNPRKIIGEQIWGWYGLSSQTFLDLNTENSPADNFPLNRNPKVFPQLASISIPILVFMGEKDDIIIKSLKEDLELLKNKATSCKNFTTAIVNNAVHTYDDEEKAVASLILKWIKKNF
jgi:pimeloyl-ACP methyl ester carboxylesterase